VSTTRTQIREFVRNNPGIHFNELRRQLDIATGQAQYHLRKLRREQHVEREEICGRTHFYPPTYTAWEREAIALLRRETTREIVVLLLDRDATRPGEIAERLDLARSTVEWHLSNLVEHGIASKRTVTDPDRAERVVVELTDPGDVYRLLREIEPRFTDRLVDRFTRLTDTLFDD